MLGPEGIAIFIHRQVLDAAKDRLNVSFAFGPLGRCRVILSPADEPA